MPLPDHVWTTSARSAGRKGRPWQRRRASRACDDPGAVYAFTDGATKGSYAAVLVHPGGRVEEEARWRAPTATRNVGAEWDGLLLGLELAAPGARLTLVVDLLWLHAQLIGVRRTIDPELVEKLERARRLIEEKRLALTLVHHDGHQADGSDFTRWNGRADELCAAKAKELAPPSSTKTTRRTRRGGRST